MTRLIYISLGLFFLLGLLGCNVETEFVEEKAVVVPAMIDIEPMEKKVLVGDTLQFDVQYSDTLGRVDTTVTYAWETTSDQIKLLPGNKFEGLKDGLANLNLHVLSSSGDSLMSTRITLVVYSLVSSDSTTFSISAPTGFSNTLDKSDSVQFTADLSKVPDSLKVKVTWKSSDSSVLSVSSSGMVKALGSGTASILLSLENKISTPLSITVKSSSRTGNFEVKPGANYELKGTGSIETGSDGKLSVKFGSNFKVSNGPGLGVYLSPTNVVSSQSLRLGVLKELTGEQTYSLPDSVTINQYDWIIIHCEPFDVTFGYAKLNE